MATEFCPRCSAPRVGSFRFCRSCQFDFDEAPPVSAALPTPQVVERQIPPQPTAPATRAAAQPRRSIDWAGALILIAGCLAALASFLPWVTASAAFIGTISRNGFDGGGDGIITLAIGIIIALLGFALLSRSGNRGSARVGALIGAAVLGLVAVVDINNVNERIRDIDSTLATASVGTGLFLVAFAAVLTLIGALLPAPKPVPAT